MPTVDFHKLKAAVDLEASGAQPLSGDTLAERLWEALLMQESQRLLEANAGRTGPGCLEPWPGQDGKVAMRTANDQLVHTGVFTDINGDEVRLDNGTVVDRRKYWPLDYFGTERKPEHVVGYVAPEEDAAKNDTPVHAAPAKAKK